MQSEMIEPALTKRLRAENVRDVYAWTVNDEAENTPRRQPRRARDRDGRAGRSDAGRSRDARDVRLSGLWRGAARPTVAARRGDERRRRKKQRGRTESDAEPGASPRLREGTQGVPGDAREGRGVVMNP